MHLNIYGVSIRQYGCYFNYSLEVGRQYSSEDRVCYRFSSEHCCPWNLSKVSGLLGTGYHFYYWRSQTSPKLACQGNKNGNTQIRQCLIGKTIQQHCTLANAMLLKPLEDTDLGIFFQGTSSLLNRNQIDLL